MKNSSNKSVGLVHSLASKIIILVIATAFLATLLCTTNFSNLTKDLMSQRAADNMTDLSIAYGNVMERNLGLDYEGNNALLKDATVTSIEGSYTYLVSSDGTMLYHPDQSKVGNPVENAVVTGLVAEIQAGNTPEDAFTEYEYKGAIKYAAYNILSDNSILVVTADEDVVLSYQSTIASMTAIILTANFALFTIVGFLFSFLLLTKPLRSLTEIVGNTADFDFSRTSGSGRKLVNRKDEIGAIAKAISQMRSNMRNIANDLRTSNDVLANNMNAVAAASTDINDMCADNSSTTEELAAGMQETAAAAETINGNIQSMQSESNGIQKLTQDGDTLSEAIMQRAEELHSTTVTSSQNARNMYTSVKEKTDQAIEDSKAVSKINELTNAIMAISSQTSLLALNANIEAARAGEAGRGFAVVATEIGSLASQTADTVTNINAIVGEVNEVVSRMADTLTESISFLENVVIKDYEQFEEVSVQYREDATTFKGSMADIEHSISTLTKAIDGVADSLLGITNTVTEATVGVTEIAGKTSDVVAKTSDNTNLIDDCMESVKVLNKIADTFKVE